MGQTPKAGSSNIKHAHTITTQTHNIISRNVGGNIWLQQNTQSTKNPTEGTQGDNMGYKDST